MVEAQPGTTTDPFTKIRFDPRKGLDMVAPIRPGVLKEIPGVDDVHEA